MEFKILTLKLKSELISFMYKKFILKNGITVLDVPMPQTNACTVLVLVKVGSRYESKKINGASHFLEHLFFKGTKKRPTTLSLSKELDSVGAEFNAFTSKNVTGFYVKINYENLELAIDLLSDMLLNSTFKEQEIMREKKVIIEEINMYEDNPMMYVEDIFEEIVFKNNSLAWKISGEKKDIENMERKDLLDYKNKYYFAENIFISVAGKTDGRLESLLNKYFVTDKIKSKNKNAPFENFSSFQKKPQCKVIYKDTEQVQLAMGFPSFSYNNKNMPALSLLSIILGGNMSSRLFIKVRERRGLAYFVRTNINTYEDTGSFMIQAGLDKSRVNEAIKVILEELKNIVKEGVKPAELEKAKQFIKGKLILDLEDSLHLAEWFAKQTIYTEELKTPEQKFELLQKVTLGQIKKVAGQILKQQKLNLAVIGPFKEEKDFIDLLKM